jgi:lysophospholipase L1-like esterase
VVLVNLGENGVPPEEAVTAALTKLRQRCAADTRILVTIPVSGRGRAEITAAVGNHVRSSRDTHIHLIDAGELRFDTADGQHPTAAGHRAIFQALVPLVEPWVKHPTVSSPRVPE